MKHSEKKYTAWLNIWGSQHSIVGLLLSSISDEMHKKTTISFSHADAPLDCNSWLNKAVNLLPLKVNRKREHCEVIRLLSPTAWSELWFGEDESQEINLTVTTQQPVPVPHQVIQTHTSMFVDGREILMTFHFSRTFIPFKNTLNLDASLWKVYIYLAAIFFEICFVFRTCH